MSRICRTKIDVPSYDFSPARTAVLLSIGHLAARGGSACYRPILDGDGGTRASSARVCISQVSNDNL